MFRRLKYNALALLGASLGIINSAVIWKIFGTSPLADAWLVTAAITASLALLSLCSVEQYLVFAADSRVLGEDEASSFQRTVTWWALLFGVAFYCVCALLSNVLVNMFVAASASDIRKNSATVIYYQFLPLLSAPLTYVARQHFNLQAKYGKAYLVTLAYPVALCLLQAGVAVSGSKDIMLLAYSVAIASIVQLVVSLFARKEGLTLGKISGPTFFGTFLRNSFSMRLGHSFHSFVSSIIINSALSTVGPGGIATFQYAKKFADGINTVAVGPQASIYLSRVSNRWVAFREKLSITDDIKNYIKVTLPLLLLLTATTTFALSMIFDLVRSGKEVGSDTEIRNVFLILAAWQGIIFFESVSTVILTVAKQSKIFWAVNALFIVVLYLLLHVGQSYPDTYSITTMACAAQLISLSLYTFFARRTLKQRTSIVNQGMDHA